MPDPKQPGRIPLLIPDMPAADDVLPFLRRIDAARWYTNFGPLVREFEQALAAAVGAGMPAHVATVASCTAGLELALAAAELRPGSRVLLPALTFVATAMAIRRSGHQPVLADVDSSSWLLTPEIARRIVTRENIDCVMPVSAFGCAQDAAAWDEFGAKTRIPVIIDAAGAFGNQAIGRHAAAVFSLHATKSLGIGEGGFVASGSAQFAARVRQLSNFGIDLATGNAQQIGSNAKMSEYHAAVGLAALARWNEVRVKRIVMAAEYAAELAAACPAVTLQQRPATGVYTIFSVCLPERTDVETVRARLHAAGIETRRWYVPLLFGHAALNGLPAADALRTCRGIAGRLLGLPMHLELSAADRTRVCRTLAAALGA